ncbi:hypothetical protein BD413DRAFT_555388 [Trametes elegans]|nr:hypothetical protein BD413DRAFT_555388 [Trametes elegans]
MMPDELIVGLFPRLYENIARCDGVILASPEPFEPEGVQAIKHYYADTSRAVYVCGPLHSSTHPATNEKPSQHALAIADFLESTLKTSGKKSLIYISFGSMFWPIKTSEKVWTFLDVVMERNIPFILSHGSPFAVVPDEIKEKVRAYGKAILSPWSPQQVILDHPATGWFVSHGGHNSVIESVSAGVPL